MRDPKDDNLDILRDFGVNSSDSGGSVDDLLNPRNPEPRLPMLA